MKQTRALRCEAVYLPHGIDVRVLERDDLIRTALCRSAPEVEQVSAEWSAKLALVGWEVIRRGSRPRDHGRRPSTLMPSRWPASPGAPPIPLMWQTRRTSASR